MPSVTGEWDNSPHFEEKLSESEVRERIKRFANQTGLDRLNCPDSLIDIGDEHPVLFLNDRALPIYLTVYGEVRQMTFQATPWSRVRSFPIGYCERDEVRLVTYGEVDKRRYVDYFVSGAKEKSIKLTEG